MKTPPNVRMISTSPAELAWMLSGVIYPADADEHPDVYVSDFQTAVKGRAQLTESQIKPRNARAMAARFIQTLLSKVRTYYVHDSFCGLSGKIVKRVAKQNCCA